MKIVSVFALMCLLVFGLFMSCESSGLSGEDNPTISLNKNTLTLEIGKTERLVAGFEPVDTEFRGHTWSTSDASIVSVDETGLLTAKGFGKAVVTVTALAGGSISSCEVTVVKKIIPVSSVSLDITEQTLAVGEKVQLTATILPKDATDKSVVWYSDAEDIAKVDSTGLVTALSVGVANIIVVTVDGSKYYSCEIVVSENGVDFSAPTISSIKESSAEVCGSLTSIGLTIDEFGVCYATTPKPTIDINKIRALDKDFVIDLNNLEHSTQYFVRLYAIANNQVYYSEEANFTTLVPLKTQFDLIEAEFLSTKDKNHKISQMIITSPSMTGYEEINICWGYNPHPTVTDNNKTIKVDEEGKYQTEIKVTSNTVYLRSYKIMGAQFIYNDDEVVIKADDVDLKRGLFLRESYPRVVYDYTILSDDVYEITVVRGPIYLGSTRDVLYAQGSGYFIYASPGWSLYDDYVLMNSDWITFRNMRNNIKYMFKISGGHIDFDK